jgi:poly(A)-specific ribonuclease
MHILPLQTVGFFASNVLMQNENTLQGFQDAIHDLFPKIVDTKYLATHAEGDLNASPTLQEIAEGLVKQPLPEIVTHADHSKYRDTEAFHEAGYDSLLTATIMIRLAAKLGAASEKQTPAAQTNSIPVNSCSAQAMDGDAQDFVRNGREKVSKPVVALPLVEKPESSITGRQKRKKNRKKSKAPKEVEERRFHTKNIFDNLRDMRIDPEDAHDSASPERGEPAMDFEDAEAWAEEPVVEAGSWQNQVYVQDKSGWVHIEQTERHAMEMMPKFDDEFWAEFGNTLRVFGTEEKLLRIAKW